LLSRRDGLDFNLAYIPATFNEPRKEDFDTNYMRKLFQVGYTMAVQGYPWEKSPPGIGPIDQETLTDGTRKK
ncbi:MAG: hypothetical protein HGA74_14480, partial [Deltaproteobacteria bacterium]|nr:hypothetical protein [Deltaproteobacteria bacterium]